MQEFDASYTTFNFQDQTLHFNSLMDFKEGLVERKLHLSSLSSRNWYVKQNESQEGLYKGLSVNMTFSS